MRHSKSSSIGVEAGVIALAAVLLTGFGGTVNAGPAAGTPAGTASGDAKGAATGQSQQRCQLHGGRVTATADHFVETIYDPKDIRVYLYTSAQAPLVLGEVRGTVRVTFKRGSPKVVDLALGDPVAGEQSTYFCPMHPEVVKDKAGECSKCGMTLKLQNRLLARADFSKVEPDTMRMTYRITGLEGQEKEIMFNDTYVPPGPGHDGDAKAKPRKSAGGKPARTPLPSSKDSK